MFSRISTSLYVLATFTVLAAATPWGQPATTAHPVTTTVTVTAPGPTVTAEPASQCNVSGLQCCNSVQSADSSAASALLGLLGIVVQDLSVLVGITCTPINVLGIGAGGACTAQPVCCEDNDFNGVVAIGCVPINIGL